MMSAYGSVRRLLWVQVRGERLSGSECSQKRAACLSNPKKTFSSFSWFQVIMQDYLLLSWIYLSNINPSLRGFFSLFLNQAIDAYTLLLLYQLFYYYWRRTGVNYCLAVHNTVVLFSALFFCFLPLFMSAENYIMCRGHWMPRVAADFPGVFVVNLLSDVFALMLAVGWLC